MSRPRPGTIFAGEARRQSRRWQLYGVRLAYAVLLLGVAVSMWIISQSGRVDDRHLGAFLFQQFRDYQVLVTALLGPALAALAAVEERRSGAIELLMLTRVPPGQIYLGKLAAQLLVPVAVLVGGLPIMALPVAVGGVAPWAVVNATVCTMAIMLSMGVVAAMVGVHTGRLLPAVLTGTTWGWLAFFWLPMAYLAGELSGIVRDAGPWPVAGVGWLWEMGMPLDRGLEVLTPVAGAMSESPSALWGALWAALSAVVMLSRSEEIVAARGRRGRITRRGGWWARTLLYALVFAWAALRWSWIVDATRFGGDADPAVFAVIALVAGSGLFLDAALFAFEVRTRPGRRSLPLLGNPFAWREAVTGSATGGPVWQWWLAGAWSFAILQLWWLLPGNHPMRLQNIPIGESLMAVGILVAAMSATASIQEERTAGTIALVVGTTSRSWRIVAGKLVVVGLRALPFLAAGAVAREWVYAAWIVPFWATVSLTAMLVALSLRSALAAWAVNLVAVFAFAIAMAQIALWPAGGRIRHFIALPMVDDAPPLVEVVVSSAGFVVAAVVLFVVVSASFRRLVRRY